MLIRFYLAVTCTVLLCKVDNTDGKGRILYGKFFGTLKYKDLPFHAKDKIDVPTLWLNQPLDHSNGSDTRTWKQRYFKNDAFYEFGGPICINIGGEGAADPRWLIQGEMVSQCSDLKGMLYVLEHRFYGESHPLPDASVASLKYLSMREALADIYGFIYYIRLQDGLQDNKVILYGGSYAGTLCAYFTERYPEVAFGCVASSAPIAWKYDYIEYLETVGRVVKETNANCYDTIKSGMRELQEIIATSLKACNPGEPCKTDLKNLKLCNPLDANKVLDVQNINSAISGLFSYFTQYNNLLSTGVKDLCSYFETESLNNTTSFEKLASLTNRLNLEFETDCLDYSNEKYCDYIAAESWEDDAVTSGARTWTWQVCNEVGSMQSTNSPHQPFGRNIPTSFFAQQCRCAFGPEYTEGFILRKVYEHTTLYGSRSTFRLRTVYVNGGNDPWAAIGITDSNQLLTSISNPVIVIEGGSHCNDLVKDKETDSSSLINTRSEIFEYIKNLLTGENCSSNDLTTKL